MVHHHKQQPGVQTNFRKDVKSLVAVTEELGNPFEDESGTHCAWHWRDGRRFSKGDSRKNRLKWRETD